MKQINIYVDFYLHKFQGLLAFGDCVQIEMYTKNKLEAFYIGASFETPTELKDFKNGSLTFF